LPEILKTADDIGGFLEITMDSPPPPVLAYASPAHTPRPGAFIAGSLVLAICFFVSFWIVEVTTSNLVLFHLRLIDYVDPEKQQFGDFIIEFLWSLPATFLMFFFVNLFPPHVGWRLRWDAILTAIAGACAYSWVRWALHCIRFRLSDGPDFLLAMALAMIAGIAVSFVRSRGNKIV
jgi:hypothetical protein